MRFSVLFLLILGACASITGPAEIQRRAAIEVQVKSGFDAIQRDIIAGGGPALGAAMDAARIPEQDRPARVIQMQRDQGLYQANPGALIIALATYGQ